MAFIRTIKGRVKTRRNNVEAKALTSVISHLCWGMVAIVALGLCVAKNLPDIIRYIKISRM